MSYESENVQVIDGVEVLKNEQMVSLLHKAEIDTQIATAKAFPRSLKQSLDRIMSMATLTTEIAESCEYALPRGFNDDGTRKILNGPSVRLAEIVFSQYGNLRAGMRVIRNDGKMITAQGICHDLETNSCVTLEVSRSILQHEWIPDPQHPGKNKRSGRMITMSEDMQVVSGNAACAIAFRNAVLKVVGAAIIDPVYQKTKEVALGEAETLPVRRTKALDYLHLLGVTDPQICQALGLHDVLDIDLAKLAIIRGICTSIKEGGSTIEQIFPKIKPKPAEAAKAATDATAAAIKAQQDKAAKNKGGRPRKTPEAVPATPKPVDTPPPTGSEKVEPK